jgi:hypothetical protein
MEISTKNSSDQQQSLLTVARAKSLLDKEESSDFASNYSGDDIRNDRIDIRRVDSHNTQDSSIFDGLDNASDTEQPRRREFHLEAASPTSSVEVSIQGQMSIEDNVSLWNYSKLKSKMTNPSTEGEFTTDQSTIKNDSIGDDQNFSTVMDDETNSHAVRYNEKTKRISASTSKYNVQSKDQHHDKFVRSGTRLKSLLDTALKQVAIGVSTEGEVELSLKCDQEESEKENYEEESLCSGQKRKRLHDDNDDEQKHASELAREKMAEVMVLKKVSCALDFFYSTVHPRKQ